MATQSTFTLEQFTACDWQYDISPDEQYGYSSVMQSLQALAKEKREAGEAEQAELLGLLARAASMMLVPGSINEPFKPFVQDFNAGRRSAIPEDFTEQELVFFETIISHVDDIWLKARVADLLWLCKKPKDPDLARVAIEAYMSHPIDSKNWRRGVDDCWERAARLATQIKEQQAVDSIKHQLFAAFGLEYSGSEFMPLWLANQLDKLQLDFGFREDIAQRLFMLGTSLKERGKFDGARSYLELAAKKSQQINDEESRLASLLAIADCFEMEADSKVTKSNIVANSFYENAIQAYRRIPAKHRDDHNVEGKIKSIRDKLTDTGKSSLDEMGLVKGPQVDISDMVKASCAHVSEKHTWEEALMYFAGLYPGPNYVGLVESAQNSIQQNPLSSLMCSSHMSSDGRVIAKTPAANFVASDDDSANQLVLQRQVQQHFSIEVELIVEGNIRPALRQILMEHRITRELLEALCHHSPIICSSRVKLMGFALWLGFEYEFGNAIHLICPQIEHIVRTQLKEAGAHTSNIDREGIETENGLSTLMDLPISKDIFGDDLTFEIKSIFTESLGFNLRNEVAHGLLNDRSSASTPTVYAWWMALRLVINSLWNGSFSGTKGKAKIIEKQDESADSTDCDNGKENNGCTTRDVTSGAFTQVVVEKAGKVIWRSTLELTESKKHRDNRERSMSGVFS